MSDVLSVDLAIYVRCVVGGLSHISDLLSVGLDIYVKRVSVDLAVVLISI